ncbi:hypothetical protein VPNG_02282 [Cytospora leucostoma]|uniref:Uncharacterized protein n=1 Tax=Cytospora leucostoma TaxID=1230097 RepID=A0A423XGK4_9PEZI|nr:hypothetical protein VPNG_02282 [Cytospora leucostoma]
MAHPPHSHQTSQAAATAPGHSASDTASADETTTTPQPPPHTPDAMAGEPERLRRETYRPMMTTADGRRAMLLLAAGAGGDAQFDEAAMEEAVRALKRRRRRMRDGTASDGGADTESDTDMGMGMNDLQRGNGACARKMYAYGPEVGPPAPGLDGDIDGLVLDTELLSLSDERIKGEFSAATIDVANDDDDDQNPKDTGPAYKPGFNLLESICSHIWLATEVGKHMRPADIVRLYSVSRSFHLLVRQFWQSTVTAWGEHMAPSSQRVFFWKFYSRYAIQDPTGTTWAAPGPFASSFPRPAWAAPLRGRAHDASVRLVPGLRYLAMIAEREVRVRDILACLARAGHRLPASAHVALKKIWLLMDISTNGLRRAFVRNGELWTDGDLYDAQMFLVKLQMRFNEPVFGPNCPSLVETLLGQREGLTPLWRLLRGGGRKGFRDLLDVMQMRARYCVDGGGDGAAARHRDRWEDYFGVPAWDLGFGHLEGWGEGVVHLSRPDELIVEEAVRRGGMALRDHLVFMVFWGHVDWEKRRNLVPTEEEMYMSDDELPPLTTSAGRKCGNVPFEHGNWLPVHAAKARWDSLTDEEKLAINKRDELDDIKFLPWDDDDEGFFDPDPVEFDGTKTAEDDDGDSHGEDCICEECEGACKKCGEIHDEEDDEECCGSGSEGDEAEDEGDDEDEDESEEKDKSFNIPAGVTDPAIIKMWNKLTTKQKQHIASTHASAQARLHTRRRVSGTAIVNRAPIGTTTLYPRDYKISDATCLALLRRYDVFPDEMFSPAPPGEEYEEHREPEGVEGEADEMMDEDNSGGDGDDENSTTDDEALKALGNEEYSDDELDFDVDKYKSYLAEAREEIGLIGGFADGGDDDEEDGDLAMASSKQAHEADVEGSEATRIPMKLPDTRYC